MNGLGRKKEDNNNKQTIFTKETLGVVLILFATLCLVCLITRGAVFSAPGQFINAFLFGVFGVFAFAVVTFIIAIGVLLVVGKKIKISLKRKALITTAFSLIALIVHVITMHGNSLGYGEYIVASYNMAGLSGFTSASGGGLITAIIAYPLVALLTEVGSYVILGVALVGVCYFMVKDYLNGGVSEKKASGTSKFRSSFVKKENKDLGVSVEGEKEYPVSGVSFPSKTKQQLFVNNPNDFAVKNKREIARDDNSQTSGIKLGFSKGGLGIVTTGAEVKPATATDDYKKKLEYVKTPAALDVEKLRNNSRPTYFSQVTEQEKITPSVQKDDYFAPTKEEQSYTTVSGYINPREVVEEIKDENEQKEIPFIEEEQSFTTAVGGDAEERAESFEKLYAETPEVEESAVVEEPEEIFTEIPNSPVYDKTEQTDEEEIPFIEEEIETEEVVPVEEQPITPTNLRATERVRDIFFTEESKEEVKEEVETENTIERGGLNFTSRAQADGNLGGRRGGFGFGADIRAQEQIEPEIEKPKKVAPPINREYFRPPLDLLESRIAPLDAPKENHQERMEIIQRTLEEFHINAIPQSYVQGPAFTRYEIMMPAGVSVKKVLNFDDDLKMRLAAKDGVRIEAPIPGKNLVGVEVANTTKSTVGFREVMEWLSQNPKKGGLVFAVGKDIVGNAISYDLSKGPHYLIAGATGSGKSVCLHVMILSLLMRYSPEELKVVLVDPKSVEFRKYEHIPHLLVDEIITEPKRVLALLKWAYDETNRRNDMFTAAGGEISNIDDYNKYIASDTVPKLPRIVFFIDELADLMEACKKDLEQRIRMIAAKSRSAGIHLVLATQRPSVDVITGTIKANLPSRIALKVMNYADSSTILGEGGAEKLLGNGDMLFKDSSMGNYERYQGAYISGREITNVVNYIKEKNTAYFDDELVEFLDKETKPRQEEVSSDGESEGGGENEFSDLFLKALWLAVNSEQVSISLLQRRFQIGYSRAGGLVDKMEMMGFITGNEGSKARRVLLSREDFLSRFGAIPE